LGIVFTFIINNLLFSSSKFIMMVYSIMSLIIAIIATIAISFATTSY